ncbi:MAG: ArsR family transcriptional regulator, partial [Planctomycetaceae bacterium]|nr:ArsR family transcriptional regulator [Planctomycetaceae bacterium]
MKGKLTTDSKRHSGEGIFFASRSFDGFMILSGNNKIVHSQNHEKDFVFESDYIQNITEGTIVVLCLKNSCTQTMNDVYRLFTTDTDNGFQFDKTMVPVRFALFGDEMLISRSQAKRLLMRFEHFRSVVLDFADVYEIGQAFA